MHNLESFRLVATSVLGSAVYDLRIAAGTHAPTSPPTGLHLGQFAAGVNQALVRLPWQVGRGTTGLASPSEPGPWMAVAGDLHDAVADAFDAVVGLLEAAENSREVVAVPDGAKVLPGDPGLFGFGPCGEAFDGWTAPTDVDALATLPLELGSPAWTRRVAIVWSADRWALAHKAALDASGAGILAECARELDGLLRSVRNAMLDVPGSSIAAIRAKAKAAVRALIEISDDPGDLVGIARAYAAEQDAPASLAWSVLADLLALADGD